MKLCNPANPKEGGIADMWQETFPVRFASIDRSDRMTLSAMFQFFQEAAICHAENLNVGREEMARTGQIWILSRMSVIAERRPDYWETITLRSWPRGGEKLFAIRDYDILGKDGAKAVSARSCWIILDREKRRPLRPQSVMEGLPKNEGLDAMDSIPAGLAEHSGLEKVNERKALYSDIDYNGHVNNIRYIQWIEDAIDSTLIEKAAKMRLDINYLVEILGGEITEIFYAPLECENTAAETRTFAFEGRKAESGTTAFRAELRLDF